MYEDVVKSWIKMSYPRRHAAIFISVMLFGSLIFYWLSRSRIPQPQIIEIVRLHGVDNNNSCHYILEGDVAPSAEDPDFHPAPNSIYFHETSCRGGLNSRQACAVESAARANIDSTVYLFFSSPVTEHMYYRTNLATLREYPNIKIVRAHVTDYAKNTPMEDMFAQLSPLDDSKHRVEHTSDILRFLTLYKWGGIYLDTDMIVVKSFSPPGYNWVSREDAGSLSTAVAAIGRDEVGIKLVTDILNEMKNTFRPDLWSHNGPGAITRVFLRWCNSTTITDFNRTICQGAHVYGPEYFYPVHYSIMDDYFRPGAELKNCEKAYTHHFWNKLTHDYRVDPGTPYRQLAQWYCPKIYELYGYQFGH